MSHNYSFLNAWLFECMVYCIQLTQSKKTLRAQTLRPPICLRIPAQTRGHLLLLSTPTNNRAVGP